MDNEILDTEFVEQPTRNKKKNRLLLIWGIILALGVLFRMFHFPGSSLMILSSTSGLAAFTLYTYLSRNDQSVFVIWLLGGSILWLIALLFSVYVNEGIPFNHFGLLVYGGFFTFFLGLHYLIEKLSTKQNT